MFREEIFNNFVRLNRGFDLPDAEIENGPFPVVASTSIKSRHKSYRIKAPGVVTGRSGSLGFVQYISENYWPLNTALYVKDFKGNYPKFVYYFLQQMHLENFNSGAGVPSLNQNHLHKVKISIPDVKNQKKIAAVLSVYDDLIENNQRRIALLEKMAEEIYREWFVRLRFPGYEKVKVIKGVPEGWSIDKVESIGKVITGKTPSTEITRYFGGEFHFIKTPDMHNNMFILDTDETLTKDGIDSQKSQTIPANSICVSCIGTGGIVSITTRTCQTNQQINTIVLQEKNQLEWAFFTIRNLKETIEMFGSTGTTMTNLSKGKFSSLKLIKPDQEIVKQFNLLASPLFEQIANLLQQTKTLKKSRDLLLPRLISGKLSVEHLNIQFPPSLLDEIGYLEAQQTKA